MQNGNIYNALGCVQSWVVFGEQTLKHLLPQTFVGAGEGGDAT